MSDYYNSPNYDDYYDYYDYYANELENERLNAFTPFVPPFDSCLSYPTSGVIRQARVTCIYGVNTNTNFKLAAQPPTLVDVREVDLQHFDMYGQMDCKACDESTRIEVRERAWRCWNCDSEEGNGFVWGGRVEDRGDCRKCGRPRDSACVMIWTKWTLWNWDSNW